MKRMLSLMVSAAVLTVGVMTGVAGAQGAAQPAPKDVKPVESKPAESKPAEPKPAEKPGVSKPADGKPAEQKPEEKKDPVMDKFVYVKLATSMGDIYLELNNEKAPISVKNFLSYTDKKHYDNTIFHRVISNFMVQGGGFTEDMKEKEVDKPIQNEWQNGLKNIRGSVAMARTQVANSATSQFFINVVDNAFLSQPRDGAGYAVFGSVVKGMDVVDKIKNVKTGSKGGHKDVPLEPVKIVTVTKVTAEEASGSGEKK